MINKKIKDIYSNTSDFNEDRYNRILKALNNYSFIIKEEFKYYIESIGNTSIYAGLENIKRLQ